MNYLRDIVKVTDVDLLQPDYPEGTLILTDSQAVIDECVLKGLPVAAFEHGGEWLDELRKYIFANKQTVAQFLKNNIQKIKLVPSEATYLLWLDCTALGMGSKELSEHIRCKTGLFLTNGEPFGGDGFLRMNIACPRSLLTDGLERLKKAVDMITEDSDS